MRIASLTDRAESELEPLRGFAGPRAEERAENRLDTGLTSTLQKEPAEHVILPPYERNVCRIYRVGLAGALPSPRPAPAGFEFRLLGPDDDTLFRRIESQDSALAANLKSRIEGHDVCLAAFCGDEMAGLHVVAFGQVTLPLVHKQRIFRAGEAWSERLVVAKGFRGQGVATYLRRLAFEELRRRGIKKLYGGTSRSNLSALTAAQKAGFVEVAGRGKTRFLKIK